MKKQISHSFGSGPEREFETQFHWIAGDLPQFEREYRFNEKRRWRFDFAWPAHKLAVEIDGGRWVPFGGRHAGDGDREKLNSAAALGWTVFRYSSNQLRSNPVNIFDEIREFISRKSILY